MEAKEEVMISIVDKDDAPYGMVAVPFEEHNCTDCYYSEHEKCPVSSFGRRCSAIARKDKIEVLFVKENKEGLPTVITPMNNVYAFTRGEADLLERLLEVEDNPKLDKLYNFIVGMNKHD